MVPESLDSKRNYWKLDPGQITAKMVRRHFKGILPLFPELASKVETENMSRAPERHPALDPPVPATCRAVQIRCEVKFSSPFSIESLLKRDSPSARASGVSVRAEQQPRPAHRRIGKKRNFSWDSEESLLLQAPVGRYPMCPTGGSTHLGLASKNFRSVYVHGGASFPVYAGGIVAPYFTSPHNSYHAYSVPTFTHDTLRFRL